MRLLILSNKKNYLKQLEDSLKHLKPKDKTISVLGSHYHWTNSKNKNSTKKNANIINLGVTYVLYKEITKYYK